MERQQQGSVKRAAAVDMDKAEYFELTPPRKKAALDEEEQENQATIVMKPFYPRAQLTFQAMLGVQQEVKKTLYVRNLDPECIQVEVLSHTPKLPHLRLEETSFNIPSQSEIPVQLTWRPSKPGTFTGSAIFRDNKGRRGSVNITFKATLPAPRVQRKKSVQELGIARPSCYSSRITITTTTMSLSMKTRSKASSSTSSSSQLSRRPPSPAVSNSSQLSRRPPSPAPSSNKQVSHDPRTVSVPPQPSCKSPSPALSSNKHVSHDPRTMSVPLQLSCNLIIPAPISNKRGSPHPKAIPVLPLSKAPEPRGQKGVRLEVDVSPQHVQVTATSGSKHRVQVEVIPAQSVQPLSKIPQPKVGQKGVLLEVLTSRQNLQVPASGGRECKVEVENEVKVDAIPDETQSPCGNVLTRLDKFLDGIQFSPV